MKRLAGALGALMLIVVAVFAFGGPATGSDSDPAIAKNAANGKLKPGKLRKPGPGGVGTIVVTMPFLSNGTIAAAQEANGVSKAKSRLRAADGAGGVLSVSGGGSGASATGVGKHSLGCGGRDGKGKGNVRVNQDCTFRRQAETDIAYNPADPNNLLAGQNDSRVGFNQCGFDYSTNNGKDWGDELPPFRSKLNSPEDQEPVPGDPNRHTIQGGPGTLHTYDAGSDPAVAFDSKGRGYFSCVTFDIASNASMLYVTASPAGAQGSFFFNVNAFDRRFVVAEDNSPNVFHDKEFIVADTFKSSPNRDNVYVTWTAFNFDVRCDPDPSDGIAPQYCESPIFGSMTTDGGLHWSTPEEISGSAPGVCSFGNFFDPTQGANDCNLDQGSDPTVLPNGDVVVAFNNGNTAAGNPNAQQLAVKCHPTGSSPAGTAHMNCAPPRKIGDDIIVGEPACDFGRGPEECIPGAYIRTNDFPRIATHEDNGHVYVTWQDYQRRDNSAKEFSIQLAESTDGGLTWSPTRTVNPDTELDHYFPAIDLAEVSGGDRVGVSYYRTGRVPNENTTPPGGFLTCNENQGGDPAACNAGVGLADSDYVLAGGQNLETPYDFKVLSPVFPPPNGIQSGFNGDYSGLTINKGNDAHPSWSDTRNVDPFAPQNGVINDEDHFTDNTGLPNGKGKAGPGTVGKR